MITRMDLEEKLSESSSGSQGPSGSLEPEACGGSTNPCQTDSSPWTKLEPGVNSSGGHESPSYSLQSETGNYECSVSGLRWVCEEEVSFQYHFCSWGGHMERMESIKYMPAGPLIDIKVITGRLNEVYLPHWICTEDDSKISDNYKVLHIDECGDVVENVSEVTPSHVKLSEPVFSPRGVLMKVGFPVKIRCSVLIYYKPNTSFLKLRVYLIPCDPALQQTVDKKELSKGFQTIEKPRPDKYLKMQKGFSLMAKTANVNPKKITLRYDNQDPNFYEVFIEKPNGIFQLELFYISKKEVESEPVWTCEIREDDYQSSASEDKHSVDDQLSAQMQSLTNRMQAVTISTTDRERLLKTLEDLTQEEFKEFKWYLRDKGVLTGLTSISKRKLESKDVLELVDLMFGTYRKHCMELTRRVLRAMDKNDLVETLSDIS
ncbi:NACHT, LRR and PYD domains-containing protein 1 homolog [Halichoeres trimaculatus]|uniref:NACHT, LRR and PYD domains-containing protein 1 homolog n=1 Tax=Halichoeres trimaculatus TaxID=147232 RepID=UPI003D9E59AF